MAQVNIYQYAEIIKSDGTKDRFGSRTIPKTITLTGTGEIYHRVWNDLPVTGAPFVVYEDGDLTQPIKWWAIKSSLAVMVGWVGSVAGSTNTIDLPAGMWMFFCSGTTTEANVLFLDRTADNEEDITSIAIWADATTPDIEFVAAY